MFRPENIENNSQLLPLSVHRPKRQMSLVSQTTCIASKSSCALVRAKRSSHFSLTLCVPAKMHLTSYSKNYYSIVEILVTQEKILCEAVTTLHGLGTADASFESPDVAPGQTLELPLWYAIHSSDIGSRVLLYQVPDIYKNKLKDICEADALAVDLGRMSKFFYEFGHHVIPHDRTATVATMLHETCRARCRSLIDLCKDTTKELKNTKKFEYIEMELYSIGCHTNELFSKWLSGKAALLHTPNMVTVHQKRRRELADSDKAENLRLSKSPRI